jgi:hypothetical protein
LPTANRQIGKIRRGMTSDKPPKRAFISRFYAISAAC